MQIGIIGSGAVGRVLASAFMKEGHRVMLGTRNTSKEEVVKWKKVNVGAETGTFSEAAKFRELLVLATGCSVRENAIKLAGTEKFNNKTVIDATNPFAAATPEKGILKFFTNPDESLMERLQKLIPGAKLVKAFNSIGNVVMYKPNYQDGIPTMFICGNDLNAKNTVSGILTDFGFETEDMGGVEAARAIEPLAILWCIPGFIRNQWNHAFKLLKK